MDNYSFQKDLIKSLQVALDTKGEYTYIYSPLFDKDLKIYCSQYSIDWVLEYKKNRLNDFLKHKKALNFEIKDNLFLFIYYFYAFVLHDIWHLHKNIPTNINKVINIGAGICLFEIYLNHIRKNIVKFSIIEKEDLFHQNNLIDVLKMSKETITSNKLKNKFLFFNDTTYKTIDSNFDLVLSFRSWCYKYDIDIYLEFVLKSINKNSVVIVDIRNKYDHNKLLKHFKESFILTTYPDHKRYLLRSPILN